MSEAFFMFAVLFGVVLCSFSPLSKQGFSCFRSVDYGLFNIADRQVGEAGGEMLRV